VTRVVRTVIQGVRIEGLGSDIDDFRGSLRLDERNDDAHGQNSSDCNDLQPI
jgi:hypothetical protein